MSLWQTPTSIRHTVPCAGVAMPATSNGFDNEQTWKQARLDWGS